jgi:uncharacterized membrane-anchored protein YitT (DUF2179 family)
MLGTVIFLTIYAITMNFYAKDKKLKMTITTNNSEKMRMLMIESDYQRGFTIFKGNGGYTDTKRDIIETIGYYQELLVLQQLINEHYPESFIYTQPIADVNGAFDQHVKVGTEAEIDA